ncbi:MAG TPA: lysylphosphatidylglycerol synthase transmembrane domain-containing protein [Gammaproteobacteria bacterium]|nr:lysylphosphatidylglycerol synthase transmembrane domain-containing protein [Gammaproteobacteria bacterium]
MNLALRIGAALLLLGAIVWYLGGVGAIAQTIAQANGVLLFAAFVVITADRALMAFKWSLLLHAQDIEMPLPRGLKIYCASAMWGLFLPTTVGADLVRAYLTTKSGAQGAKVLASIVVERIIGYLASLLMGIAGLVILAAYGGTDRRLTALWAIALAMLVAGLALFAISFDKRLFALVRRIVPERLRDGKIMRRLEEFHDTYRAFGARTSVTTVFFALTVVEQFLSILFAWVIALSIGLDVGLMFIAGVLPITLLVSRLPISFEGIGVFEGVFVLLMRLGGVDAASAVSIALIGRLIQLAAATPWWLAHAWEGKSFERPKILPGA